MGIIDKAVDKITGRSKLQEAQERIEELRADLGIKDLNSSLFMERLAELELQLEDQGWNVLTGAGSREFSRNGLRIINGLALIYWLKNPLIKRAVATQTQYVFGRGVNISAKHPLVNEVVQRFIDDPKNRAELTEHQALQIKETELQCFANLFFVFFPNKYNGHVRVRTIPMDEVTEIITNPDDNKEPWFYHRVWTSSTSFSAVTGTMPATQQEAYYPDWRYKPKKSERVKSIMGQPVHWDNPVYHVAVNKLSTMQFGVSEIYSALDWSRAYKEFLENWSTIVKAHSRFAWKLATQGGSAGVAAAKAKLATTLNSSGSTDSNPPPATGSTFIGTEGIKLEPMRTGGAQTKAMDGRYLRLMVSSATGIFEHYLTGDPSTGNLATTKAMELPMLIMFEDRQTLWSSVLKEILKFVILEAIRAGKLPGKIIIDDQGDERYILANDEDNEDPEKKDLPIDDTVDVEFKPILQNLEATIGAIVSAATLDGKSLAGTLDLKLTTRLLLTALGLDDIDAILLELFPPEAEPDPDAEPDDNPAPPGEETPPGNEPGPGAVPPVPEEEESLSEHLTREFNNATSRLYRRIDELFANAERNAS